MKKIIYPIAAALLCCTGAQAQTQTIAHRGFWTTSGSAQNSIASLVKADSVECYGSEFDLWVTADNRIVVHHDANEGDCVIERSTYSELMKHTIANGEKVPTLEQYLEKGKKLKTKLICEIKPHSDVARTLTCVDMTLKAFKKYKLTKQVTYITFSLPAFVKLLSEVPKGTEVYYLSGDLSPKQLKEMGAAGMDYSWGTICQHWDWIAEAHALGLKVNIWTIDNADEMRKLVDAGVDYITTNQPTLCNDIVQRKK